MAMVPAGFVYKGLFYGRALSHTGWKRIQIPYSHLVSLLQ